MKNLFWKIVSYFLYPFVFLGALFLAGLCWAMDRKKAKRR